MRMLLADYIKLVNVSAEDVLYDEKDLINCIEKIELIDYHQVRGAKIVTLISTLASSLKFARSLDPYYISGVMI